MAHFKQVIEYIASFSAGNNSSKGKIFENYCKWFLENDPRYSMQLKKVWLWGDWPGNWGRDKGIDLIAEAKNGDLWAIQAKAYDEDYYVTKEDVDKFLSESARKTISYRLLIFTTNGIGSNAREVIDAQEKPVGLCSLESLEKSSLDWPVSIDALIPFSRPQANTLYPHQEQALNDIIAGFEQSNKGQLHMA
jgi:predicted helicase